MNKQLLKAQRETLKQLKNRLEYNHRVSEQKELQRQMPATRITDELLITGRFDWVALLIGILLGFALGFSVGLWLFIGI